MLYGGVANTLILSKAVVDKLGVSPNAPVPERLKALEGLSISAVSPTAAAFVAIRGQAKALGVNPKYSYMSLDALMSALETRAIDGYVAAFPVWALPVLKGTAVPWLTGPKGEYLPEFAPGVSSVAMTKRDYAETHADLMRRMGLVMTEFAKAVETNCQGSGTSSASFIPSWIRKWSTSFSPTRSTPGSQSRSMQRDGHARSPS